MPARDEEATVGHVARVCLPLVDEVVVVDDRSQDDTAGVAAAAGATVVLGEGRGKGRAMRTGLAATTGTIVMFADADVTSFDAGYVRGLVDPLVQHDELVFVKGDYDRPEGGRLNELVARPLLRLLFPELSHVRQPLGGEYAGRRAVLEALVFEDGYGVDIGLLLDVAARHGVGAIAQAHLGVRVHRNRPLSALSDAAEEVMAVVLDRAGASRAEARRLA